MSNQPSILVVGATGFTGKLVVEYLSTHPARSTFNLQIGGRSSSKLAEVATSLKLTKDVQVVVFDVLDEKQVNSAVKGASVVINCAGERRVGLVRQVWSTDRSVWGVRSVLQVWELRNRVSEPKSIANSPNTNSYS